MKYGLAFILTAIAAMSGAAAHAEPVAVEVVLETQESFKFEFADGSKHFILAVKREGVAEGSGVFAGATVTEIGWHDVDPPDGGAPEGYLQFAAPNGDVAVLSWEAAAIFTKEDGKLALHNHGVWELVSGTGQFENMRGVGSLTILPMGGPNKFTLEGEVGTAP
jgi:hypothetical protein